MRIIDLSALRDPNGKIPFRVWFRRTLNEGFGWRSELDAQDHVIPIFERVLGNEFSLVREVRIPGLDTPIPIVLAGPPGVYVMYATGLKGSYRARGDAWLVLDASGNMHAAHPNLPTRARLYAEAVRKFLGQNGFHMMEVEPVLLFSRPEAFVENIKSPIRIVMCDGLESYAGSLRLLNTLYSPMEVSSIVKLLTQSRGEEQTREAPPVETDEIAPQPVIQPSDFFPEVPEAPQEPESLHTVFTGPEVERPFYPDEMPLPEPEPEPLLEEEEPRPPRPSVSQLLARTRMNSRQITLLGVFAMLDLVVICVLLVLALTAFP
jgi:hypothetical protein